ncbi:MAG: hypothetical protein PHX60_06775 [Giesbergeria sp.]|uniref:hypothetical protein n=1 Tax=Giesbergeria sp. TaxID=2818473 RepID=UPI0026022F87|nr:hypothetical protein [Giesbergeria sp.]MDD2609388.1 hypothetical protein [Giesbergeria sp.]
MQLQKYAIPLSLLLYSALVASAQQVGGLSIDYAVPFQENSVKAQAWQAKMNPEVRGMLRDFRIFEAKGTSGISDVRLLKMEYTSQIRGDIDSAASETVANIVRLPGIKNPHHTILRTKVSGHDARRVSYESERNDGRVGAEFLIVQDRYTQTAYQLQLIFSKRPSINPLASTSLDEERTLAKKVLDSVRVGQ